MHSSAARREEIQKRLELIKEQRDRENHAFDELMAQHPELSAEDISALAMEQTLHGVTRSIEINACTVHLNDYIVTKNDASLLLQAEKGHLVHDPVKRVYLGERGKVIRIMKSFQGKPAVEMRFADGAEKVFFVECLAVGDQRKEKRPLEPTAVVSTDINLRIAAATHPGPELEPEPLPGWDAIAVPRRNSIPCKMESTVVPPPSTFYPKEVPPPKAVGPTPLAAVPQPYSRPTTPPTSVALKTVTSLHPRPFTPPTTAASNLSSQLQAKSLVVSPSQRPLTSSGPMRSSVTQGCRTPPGSLSASMYRSIGLVREAYVGQPSRYTTPGTEELGRPFEHVVPTSVLKTSPEMENLVKTPRPDFLKLSPAPSAIADPAGTDSKIPTRCPLDYKAKFSLMDTETQIPRYTSQPAEVVTRCWVGGDFPGRAVPLEFQPLQLGQSLDSLEAVLSVATQALAWDVRGVPATRLFGEDGQEIMCRDSITDGMKLVVTSGESYKSASRQSSAAPVHRATAPDSSMTSPSYGDCCLPTQPEASTGRPTLTVERVTTGPRPRKSPVRPLIGGTSVTAKPIYIRVYENGRYDGDAYDHVHRTVTIRPTYKTLTAVKTLVTRELGWRDGKKVDILFDASGQEIESLQQLSDSCSVVASAGDRFIIPYPNSQLHRETMKLRA